MGNFKVSGDKVGSIIWRKNVYLNSDCAKYHKTKQEGIIYLIIAEVLEVYGHSITFPEKPSFKATKGVINLDSIFCYKKSVKLQETI